MPTPTPDHDWTGGLDPYTGPVPEDIQQLTGRDTWPGVYGWMLQQEQSIGLTGSVEGVVRVEFTEDGGHRIVFEPAEGMPEPPMEPPPC